MHKGGHLPEENMTDSLDLAEFHLFLSNRILSKVEASLQWTAKAGPEHVRLSESSL